MPWDRQFDEPVPGMKTLPDAANYIMALPKAEQNKPHWQTAAEVVLMAAEDRRLLMHARIGMLKALSHGKPDPTVTPRRKGAKKYKIVR
jgi:hypothetical protein